MYKKVYFDTLSSTNTYLKHNYKNYSDNTVLICKEQTGGHGRLGRSWVSSTDNISLSLLLKPFIKINQIARLSLMTSAVIHEVINKYTDNVLIKWPNDILVNKKKVSGILLESIYSDKIEAIIIGVGINVNTTVFPDEIASKATSLKLETDKDYDLESIIDELITTFDRYYQKYLLDDLEFLNICRKYSSVINKMIRINDEEVFVLDILDNGSLLVKNEVGLVKEISYGEITLKDEYKR